MPLRTYSLRVFGAAENVEEYQGPLRTVVKQLGSRFLTVYPDAQDVLVSAVLRVLPSELHERLVVNEEPNRPYELSAQLLEDRRRGTAILPGALQAPEDLRAWDDFLLQAQPRALLELGTASGAFARWLSARVEWFKTVDIGRPDPGPPGSFSSTSGSGQTLCGS